MRINDFIESVLGETAATALKKATERSQALGSVLGPRVILGWLGFTSQFDFDGEIPGVPDSILTFKKSENDLLAGSIGVDGEVYDFCNATVPQLASTIVVALGAQMPMTKGLRDSDLVGLGKSVDLLVRSRVLQLLKAAQEPSGTQAAPKGPVPPEGPDTQKKATASTQPKLPSQQKIKITKSQAESKCSICDGTSFNRRGDFTACYCLRALAKSVSSVATEEGFELTFGSDWTKNNIRVLLDILGAENGQ